VVAWHGDPAGVPPPVRTGQTTLARTPNIEGFWAPRPGVVQFNFMHRFHVTAAPLRKVVNYADAGGGAGLPGDAVVGTRYASNSLLVSARPNEWELFGRWAPLRESRGPGGRGVQVAHNGPAGGVDGELLVGGPWARSVGCWPARAFSSFRGEGGEVALVAGVTVRLGRYVALAGRCRRPRGRVSGDVAWSGGLQLEIPYTPHSLSMHVSNVNATTLQSATHRHDRPPLGLRVHGPLTLRRYLGAGRRPRSSPGMVRATAWGPGGRHGGHGQPHAVPARIRSGSRRARACGGGTGRTSSTR
jgi:hypothetical protein